ncbi:MAG: hypothetical protein ACRD3O_07820, partial [Terriglobia bacterium]
MQRISGFNEGDYELIQAALSACEKIELGIHANALFRPEGWFARFTWPDWPHEQAEAGVAELK